MAAILDLKSVLPNLTYYIHQKSQIWQNWVISKSRWQPWPYSILYIHRMKEKDFRPMSIATTDITFMYLFTYFYPVLSPTRKSFSITSKSLPIHLLVTSLILTSTAVERPNKDAIPTPNDLAICAAILYFF